MKEDKHVVNRHHVHRGMSYRSTVEIMVSVQSGEDMCKSHASHTIKSAPGYPDGGDGVSYEVPGGLEESPCGWPPCCC
jgi:hypothetical protein